MNPINYENLDNPYNNYLERQSTSPNPNVPSDAASDPQNAPGGTPSSSGGYGGKGGTVTTSSGESASNLAPGVIKEGNFRDLFIKNFIKSRNFYPKKGGFYIDGKTGYAEFSNVYVSGTIIATFGEIGGWIIGDTYLRAGGTDSATANILLDSANQIIRVGSGSTSITIDGVNQRIRSANYSPGLSGFNIEPDLIEATNIKARGVLSSTTFQKDTVSAVGGSLQVNKGAVVLQEDMTALDTAVVETDGSFNFAVGDILRIADNGDNEWMEVTDASLHPIYEVTRDMAGDYAPNSNPAWTKGATIVSYGQANDGLIEMITGIADTPLMRIYTHQGAPWSTVDEKVVIGNIGTKTGNPGEYGIWVKGESIYAAGLKQYDAIATKEGPGGSTEVYYNGQTYTTIRACILAAQSAAVTDFTIFVRSGLYVEQPEGDDDYDTGGFTMNIKMIGESKDSTAISFVEAPGTFGGWRWNGANSVDISNIEFYKPNGTFEHGDFPVLSFVDVPFLTLENNKIINSNTEGWTFGKSCVHIYDTTVLGVTDARRIISKNIFSQEDYGDATSFFTESASIYIRNASSVEILDNFITTETYGVLCEGNADYQNIVIRGNSIGCFSKVLFEAGGIFINGSRPQSVDIDNNLIFSNNGATGIINYDFGIKYDGSHTFTGSNISNNTVISGRTKIINWGGPGNIIENNYLYGISYYGIEVGGIASGNNQITTVRNNYIAGTSVNVLDAGIVVSGWNVIIENNFISFTYYSISGSIWGTVPDTFVEGNVIINNNIFDRVNNTSAIYMTDNFSPSSVKTGPFVITNNRIIRPNGVGVRFASIDPYDDLNISNNVGKDISDGIFMDVSLSANVDNTTIENNVFMANDSLGGFAVFLGLNLTFFNLNMSNNLFEGSIEMGAVVQSNIQGNNVTSDNYFYIEDSASTAITGNTKLPSFIIGDTFLGNSFSDNAILSEGVGLGIGWTSQRNRISNNSFICEGTCIDFLKNSSGDIISNNNMTVQGTSSPAIRCDEFFAGTILGNRMSYRGNNAGILVFGPLSTGQDRTIISSNTLRNETVTNTSPGINIWGTANDCVVTNNIMSLGNNIAGPAIRFGSDLVTSLITQNRYYNGVTASTSQGVLIVGSNTSNTITNNIRS